MSIGFQDALWTDLGRSWPPKVPKMTPRWRPKTSQNRPKIVSQKSSKFEALLGRSSCSKLAPAGGPDSNLIAQPHPASNPGRASLLSIAPVKGLVLLYLSIYLSLSLSLSLSLCIYIDIIYLYIYYSICIHVSICLFMHVCMNE